MERLTTYAGWLLGMVALAASILLYAELQNVRQELANESSQLERQKQARGAGMASKLDKAKARIAELEEELGALREARERSGDSVDPGILLKGVLAGAEDEALEQSNGGGNQASATGGLFQGIPQDRAIEAGSKMQVNMFYRDLFHALGLEPARKAEVRTILADYMSAQARAGEAVYGGTGDMDSYSARMQGAEEAMRDQLAQVLTAEELAYFEQYEAEMPARQMAMGMEMQIDMMAPDLTQENRQLVVDLMVEEMTAPEASQPDNGAVPMPEAALAQQSAAYERILAQAAQYMEPDQFAIVEEFVHQQEELAAPYIEAFQDTFEGEAAP
ncbi:MAG: hypothetical protein ACLFTT_09605 [Candidatus Hydrogenedentota bacterium]